MSSKGYVATGSGFFVAISSTSNNPKNQPKAVATTAKESASKPASAL